MWVVSATFQVTNVADACITTASWSCICVLTAEQEGSLKNSQGFQLLRKAWFHVPGKTRFHSNWLHIFFHCTWPNTLPQNEISKDVTHHIMLHVFLYFTDNLYYIYENFIMIKHKCKFTGHYFMKVTLNTKYVHTSRAVFFSTSVISINSVHP